MAPTKKISVSRSSYAWCGFFFLLGGVMVSTLAYNVMGRAIGFENIKIITLIPGFSVGAAAGLTISFLVIRNRQVLLSRLQSEQLLTEQLKSEIIERKNIEEALRESEAQLRLVTDNIPVLVAYVDRDLTLRFCNQPYAAALGFAPEDLLGRSLSDLRGQKIYDENLPEIKKTLAGEVTYYEGFRDLGGVKDRYFRATRLPHFSGDGAVIGYFNIGIDLTDYREREKQLHQAQKMEAVGQMTGGVAHDFNNILTVILGNLEFLNESASTEDDRSLIADSMSAAKRAAELTQHLLAFSRKQQLEPKLLDVEEHVQRMANLLYRVLGERIVLQTKSEDGLWPCVADPAQLESAITNLCLNARDAMPLGGDLTINCRNARLEKGSQSGPGHIAVGDYVVISIEDTGHGMSAEVLSRALEPFYTTKDVGQGSGLGLAMIYGFVQQSGGGLELESHEGRGTTVSLYLPRAADIGVTEPKEEDVGTTQAGGETVLVIEDNQGVRNLTVHMLKGMGYSVIDVANAAAARDVLEGRNDVDLVLSDVVLPGGTSGPQFADQIKASMPNLRFIFMSGYSPEAAMSDGINISRETLLRKPFQRRQLAAALRDVLDAETGPTMH